MHCAGEVHIAEDEDYDKWAIDIMVKFRDSERLQLLTGHRQSGGVRATVTCCGRASDPMCRNARSRQSST